MHVEGSVTGREDLMETQVSTSDFTATREDLDAITRASADYIEGWYTGDGERMRRCLHPELAKRTVVEDPPGTWCVRHLTASAMVAATKKGNGTRIPETERTHQITVLDVFGNIACVKVVPQPFVDFLHLARVEDRWLTVNVLYTQRHSAA